MRFFFINDQQQPWRYIAPFSHNSAYRSFKLSKVNNFHVI